MHPHWPLSWAIWMQSTLTHTISLRVILIFFFHLCLNLPCELFISVFLKIWIYHCCQAYYMPCPLYPPWFDYPKNMWCKVQVMELLIMQFCPASCHIFPLRCFNILLSTLFSHTLKKQHRAHQWPQNGPFSSLASSKSKILSFPPLTGRPDMSFSGHELALVSSFFLTHPLITPYLNFILSYSSSFPFFSSVIYPIPSIFHPLLHLHFIAYRYYLACPPMAL
jgi:hypothetical protein